MDSFLQRKKRKSNEVVDEEEHVTSTSLPPANSQDHEEPTEVKLAILSSLYPQINQETILDVLLAHEGSVTQTREALKSRPRSRKDNVVGSQQSLKQYTSWNTDSSSSSPQKKKLKSKKGSTLHLFDPQDVEEHTPCTIIHNFLPTELANDLLKELLEEAKTFEKITFKLFDNVVASPHTSSFFVESYDEMQAQKTDYIYNGARLDVSTEHRALTCR